MRLIKLLIIHTYNLIRPDNIIVSVTLVAIQASDVLIIDRITFVICLRAVRDKIHGELDIPIVR